jgi:CRISPR-associated protein Cmr5
MIMSENKQTLDQRRARHAWKAVEQVQGRPVRGEDPKRVGGQAKKLPTRIVASGLGQALAFLVAKNYAPSLLEALGEWVLTLLDRAADLKDPKDRALLLAVVNGDADFLRRATDESLAYLLWFNRFAEAAGLTKEVE